MTMLVCIKSVMSSSKLDPIKIKIVSNTTLVRWKHWKLKIFQELITQFWISQGILSLVAAEILFIDLCIRRLIKEN